MNADPVAEEVARDGNDNDDDDDDAIEDTRAAMLPTATALKLEERATIETHARMVPILVANAIVLRRVCVCGVRPM